MATVLRSMICRSGSRTSGRAAALRSSPWREVRATGHVHDLQRTAGNQAMARWLRSQFERPSLSVGRAGDKCERGADSVTDKVMRMPDAQGPVTQRAPLKIQRLCPECEEEEAFQKKDAPVAGSKSPSVCKHRSMFSRMMASLCPRRCVPSLSRASDLTSAECGFIRATEQPSRRVC
jgi:hypothetical protein